MAYYTKKLGLITFNITQDAHKRAIQTATFFRIFIQSEYFQESPQLDAISIHDTTIISRDIISMTVIRRFINASINFGNTFTGVTTLFQFASQVEL